MIDTKIDELYNKMQDENILIFDAPYFKEKKSVAYNDGKDFLVGINYRAIQNKCEEYCILAEEKAHYDVGIIPNDYNSNSYCNKLTRSRNEHRAKKLAIQRLLNKEDLTSALKKFPDICISDLADMFEVTPQFMNEALILYNLLT